MQEYKHYTRDTLFDLRERAARHVEALGRLNPDTTERAFQQVVLIAIR